MFRVCALSELPPGEVRQAVIEGVPVAVANVDGEVLAVDDTCSHQQAHLSEGWLEGCALECPLHGAAFDLRTGEPDGPPATEPVRTHAVVVQDDTVFLAVSPAPVT